MTIDDNRRRVVIAGGGIAGLAAAVALQEKGIDASVHEQLSEACQAGLAINLPGNAIAALQRLGLGDEIRSLGSPVERREYRTAGGRLLMSVDEGGFWPAGATSRALLRGDLIDLLSRRLPAGTISTRRIVGVDDRPGNPVRAIAEDGKVIEGDLLVGADGIGSIIRQHMAGTFDISASQLGEANWRFMAPITGVDCWTLWSGRGALFLLLPVGNAIYGWATLRGDPGDGDPATLRDAARSFPRVVREAVDAAIMQNGLHHARLGDVSMARWHAGRVLVLGDAAHATAPVWAQGAAMGMEDALVLAECLSTSADWQRALDSYEARRRPRVAHVQAATARMARLAKLPAWLRHATMPFAGPRSYAAAYGPLRQRP